MQNIATVCYVFDSHNPK